MRNNPIPSAPFSRAFLASTEFPQFANKFITVPSFNLPGPKTDLNFSGL